MIPLENGSFLKIVTSSNGCCWVAIYSKYNNILYVQPIIKYNGKFHILDDNTITFASHKRIPLDLKPLIQRYLNLISFT